MMGLEKLEIYQLALDISDKIWNLVVKFQYFEKDTLGKQLIRATDSIPANISEGYGRYHYLDNKKFLFYARGSLYETMTWIRLAYTRKLISEDDYEWLRSHCRKLSVKLNNFINAIGNKPNKTE